MTPIIHPIQDEMIADRAIELFLAGNEPLLFATDLGVTPEQVWNQIRVTLRLHISKNLAAAKRSAKNGAKGGRPRNNNPSPAALAKRKSRARAQKQPNQGELMKQGRYELITITWGQNAKKDPTGEFFNTFAEAAERARQDNKDFDGTLCTVEVLDRENGQYYGGNEL